MSQPPTREEILALVKHYLLDVVEGLTEEQIDSGQSIADAGANSLEMIEVISCTMRDLGVQIPRAELVLMDNLDEVVDKLFQAVLAKERAER